MVAKNTDHENDHFSLATSLMFGTEVGMLQQNQIKIQDRIEGKKGK